MYTQLTAEGQTLFDSGTQVVLTKMVLGDGYGYTLDTSSTDIRGNVVYEGVPSVLETLSSNMFKTSLIMDATVGPITYGEFALYSNSVLVALGVSSSPFFKRGPADPKGASQVKLEVTIRVLGDNFQSFTNVLDGSNEFRLGICDRLDLLPRPLEATPNAYVIRGASKEQLAFFSYTDKGLWSFDAYPHFANNEFEVVAATKTSVTMNADKWDTKFNPIFLGKTVLQFSSGANLGYCRYVTVASPSSDSTEITLGVSSMVNDVPKVGDKFFLYPRRTEESGGGSGGSSEEIQLLFNQVSSLNTSISSEISRAKQAEANLGGEIDDLVEKVTILESSSTQSGSHWNYKSTVAAKKHTLSHNLNSDFLLKEILVHDGTTYVNFIGAITEVDKNTLMVESNIDINIKATISKF